MTKEEKIELLKKIASGEVNIKDIIPKKLVWNIFENGESTFMIDGEYVSFEQFKMQSDKQWDQDNPQANCEFFVCGVSMDDPDYLKKTIERCKAKGTINMRQIGVNNWEAG